MQLSDAAAITHGALRGADRRFEGVAIDSRTLDPGDLFVAIPGELHDGHDFIDRAVDKGAAGALVSRPAGDSAHIEVADTTAALGQLAAHWRNRFELPVVAVTGSNGKTTVSAMIAAILNRAGDCLAPRGSFNNQWGVPLTLLRLRKHHTHAVIEMGMNHPGEIEYLSGIARPGVALITNAAPAHLAGLGDLQNIADAKAEIFRGLAPAGVAVLNADDAFHDHWRGELRRLGVHNILRFSARALPANPPVEVGVSAVSGPGFELHINGQRAPVCLRLEGAHNIANAAAAAAAAHAVGIGIAQIAAGLESCAALPGRLCALRGINRARVIDDSYNANPASMKAALNVLAGYAGERIAVLGRMAELGGRSGALHREVGEHARRCGISRLFGLGAAGCGGIESYARGFGKGAECFDDLERLLARVTPLLKDGVTVLVKGSRSAAMERVVARLTPASEGGAAC